MSGNDLGGPERATLLALMAVSREISNPELAKLTGGLTLTGRSRGKLNQQGLVTSRRDGRAFVHELTDKGWRWCADELAAPCPPRPGSFGGALYAVLAGLHRYLDRSGLTLADVFGTAPVPPPSMPAPDLAEQIRVAYRKLASEPRAWVSLSRLRPLLGDTPRADLDAALKQLSRTPQVNLVPQANQKVLTPADRDAAVSIGGEDAHLISIEDA